MAMTREQKIDAARGGKLFARGDIAVYLAVLCLLALFTAFAFLLRAPSGDRFIVYWQGDAVFSAPLAEDGTYVFVLRDGKGMVEVYSAEERYEDYNIIEVSGGAVRVSNADCADGTCQGFGALTRGDILCIPHGLRIRIVGEGVSTDV